MIQSNSQSERMGRQKRFVLGRLLCQFFLLQNCSACLFSALFERQWCPRSYSKSAWFKPDVANSNKPPRPFSVAILEKDLQDSKNCTVDEKSAKKKNGESMAVCTIDICTACVVSPPTPASRLHKGWFWSQDSTEYFMHRDWSFIPSKTLP